MLFGDYTKYVTDAGRAELLQSLRGYFTGRIINKKIGVKYWTVKWLRISSAIKLKHLP
jgi:hypothetical protein